MTYACIYACIYLSIYVFMYLFISRCTYLCIYGMYECTYLCVCIYLSMQVVANFTLMAERNSRLSDTTYLLEFRCSGNYGRVNRALFRFYDLDQEVYRRKFI